MATAPPPSSVSCRPAAPHERLAARLLLPAMTLDGLLDRVFVATDDATAHIVAAAAVAVHPRDRVLGRCLCELDVIESHHGHGIERTLCRLVAREAVNAGAGLVVHDWTDRPAPPVAGLRSVQERFEFTAGVRPMTDALVRRFDRFKAHGHVPAGATAVSLRDADLDAVAALHLRHFPGHARQLAVALRGGPPDHYHTDYSVVTLLDGRVTGYMVGPLLAGESLFDIHWKAVDPQFRNGWSNLMLMHALAMRLCPAGVERVRFRALTHNDDTRRVIRHLSGDVSRVETRFGLDAHELADFVA